MTDLAPNGDTTPASPVAAPEPAPTPAPPTGVGQDLLAEPPADQAVFDRGYVTKVRSEAQRYRDEARQAAERLTPYETVFSGYDDADRQVWLDLARTWSADPNQAATVMQQIANAVLTPASGETPVDTPSPADTGALEDLTPERVQQMINEALSAQQRTMAEQQAVEQVFTEVRAGGFDPDSMEGFMVLWLANNQTNGDIGAAAKEMGGYRQKIIDDYVSGRAAGRGPTPMASNGTVATGATEIQNLDDARRAADAYLRAQAGASTP